jgi:hypothetical protein
MREFMAKVGPKQKKYFTALRSALLALPEIEESIEIDEIEGEWCPAYRVRGSDLVWVHLNDRLWLSFRVEPNFEKKVAQDENLDSRAIDAVTGAEDSGGVKMVKIDIRTSDDLDLILPLLNLRHSALIS